MSSILEATIRILDREGMDAATTTNIAAVAGVSIGTLYQYFSDREAILDALQEREFERALRLMSDVLSDQHLARSPRATVKAVVHGLGGLYAACPGLHRALAVDALRGVKSERVEAFDLRVIAIVRHFLAATRANVRRTNVEAAAFVIHQAVRAVMLARLLERPPGVDEETLANEVVDLVLRYLVDEEPTKGSPTRRRASSRATAVTG